MLDPVQPLEYETGLFLWRNNDSVRYGFHGVETNILQLSFNASQILPFVVDGRNFSPNLWQVDLWAILRFASITNDSDGVPGGGGGGGGAYCHISILSW